MTHACSDALLEQHMRGPQDGGTLLLPDAPLRNEGVKV
jgi:hypothetical protein